MQEQEAIQVESVPTSQQTEGLPSWDSVTSLTTMINWTSSTTDWFDPYKIYVFNSLIPTLLTDRYTIFQNSIIHLFLELVCLIKKSKSTIKNLK